MQRPQAGAEPAPLKSGRSWSPIRGGRVGREAAHGGSLDLIQRHQKPWEGAGSRGSPGSLSLQREGTGTAEPLGAFWWGRPGLGTEERGCQ